MNLTNLSLIKFDQAYPQIYICICFCILQHASPHKSAPLNIQSIHPIHRCYPTNTNSPRILIPFILLCYPDNNICSWRWNHPIHRCYPTNTIGYPLYRFYTRNNSGSLLWLGFGVQKMNLTNLSLINFDQAPPQIYMHMILYITTRISP